MPISMAKATSRILFAAASGLAVGYFIAVAVVGGSQTAPFDIFPVPEETSAAVDLDMTVR